VFRLGAPADGRTLSLAPLSQDTQTLTALPTDLALINDEKFLPIVEEFSKDQAKFFSEFAAAFKKAQELGVPLLRDI
jgi:catalase (peroxidase I)